MKGKSALILLGLDSSGVAASCAVIGGEELGKEKILASGYVNTKTVHSKSLMPLMESVLAAADLKLSDVDGFAVSIGPGSFTGLRIGMSAVKGMAFALGKPVYAVPTLLGLAYNLRVRDCVVCAVMDARRDEVYNALFRVENGVVTRLTPDRAIAAELLVIELTDCGWHNSGVVLVGDGAGVVSAYMPVSDVAVEPLLYQNAVGVCYAARYGGIAAAAADEIAPVYLRRPQAERERLAK